MFWFNHLHKIIGVAKYFYLARYTIHNPENVPQDVSGMIAVTNHTCILDPPLVALCLPEGTRWKLFAAKKWEKVPLSGWFLKKSGAIFIHRDRVDREGLKQGLEALKEGFTFGLAPEGTRSKETGQMRKARNGAAYLAVKANAAVIPIGIVNGPQWNRNKKKWKTTNMELYPTKPIQMPDLGRRVRITDLDAYTHYIMIHIAQQIPAEYHGYYADSPALAALLRGEDPWPHCLEAEGVKPGKTISDQ